MTLNSLNKQNAVCGGYMMVNHNDQSFMGSYYTAVEKTNGNERNIPKFRTENQTSAFGGQEDE